MDAHIGSRAEYLRLTFPPDFLDVGWGFVRAHLVVRGFTACLEIAMAADEVLRFRQELAVLYATLDGETGFTAPEGRLTFVLRAQPRGRMLLSGSICSQPGGNHLQFAILMEQTCLAAPLAQLRALPGTVRQTA